MKNLKWIVFVFLVSSLSIFSQEKYTRHTVTKGETVSDIAKKYKVTTSVIYELNPDAVNGIKPKTVLLISTSKTKSSKSNTAEGSKELPLKNHEVLPKETVYGIAKQSNISVSELYAINPDLEKEGLKIGQTIKVPQTTTYNLAEIPLIPKASETPLPKELDKNISKGKEVSTTKPEDKVEVQDLEITHEVLPKESLYSIAKQYGIKVTEIQKANPELGTKSLKAGQSINIPVKEKVDSREVEGKLAEMKVEQEIKANPVVVEKPTEVTENKAENIITHEVLPKETKYGIAKKYGLSVTELEKQNPSVVKKLLVGSVLKIFSSVIAEKTLAVEKAIALEGAFVKEKFENKEVVSMAHDEDFVDQLISRASENIGTRYRSGGTSNEGFDCSGLMCYTFSNTDIKLPRSSTEMAAFGSRIETQNAQKGDLIFFSTRGSKRINHVGMVVEVLDGEIKFIHSATHGGVIISSTKESYYERNLVQVNRVL